MNYMPYYSSYRSTKESSCSECTNYPGKYVLECKLCSKKLHVLCAPCYLKVKEYREFELHIEKENCFTSIDVV